MLHVSVARTKIPGTNDQQVCDDVITHKQLIKECLSISQSKNKQFSIRK